MSRVGPDRRIAGFRRALAAGLLVAGLTRPAAAGEPPLRVALAVSLRPAVSEAVSLCLPGREVELSAGGSGVLLQQARRGAAIDLLISASPTEIDRLVDEGLAEESRRRRIASNRLVVVVPTGVEPPSNLESLAAERFDLIAVGNPRTAPLGRYTDQALRSVGLRERLAGRLIFAENARQVLDYVERGEVAAGLVYATDADLPQADVLRGPVVPQHLHDNVAYEGIALRDGGRPVVARLFLNCLTDGPGRDVLARHGFLPPAAP